MIIPNEVYSYYRKANCPICSNHLEHDDIIITSEDIGYPNKDIIYTAASWCIEDTEHYQLEIEFRDPKHIDKTAEEIIFYSDKKHYKIKQSYLSDDFVMTQIVIQALDECGTPDETTKFERLFKLQGFDLSDFDQERYINRIETMIFFE